LARRHWWKWRWLLAKMVRKITVPKMMRKISETGDSDGVRICTYSPEACLFWKRSRKCSCCLFRAIPQKGCDPFWNFEPEASKVLQLSQHEADEISILETVCLPFMRTLLLVT
jgi:hypothetical protein